MIWVILATVGSTGVGFVTTWAIRKLYEYVSGPNTKAYIPILDLKEREQPDEYHNVKLAVESDRCYITKRKRKRIANSFHIQVF